MLPKKKKAKLKPLKIVSGFSAAISEEIKRGRDVSTRYFKNTKSYGTKIPFNKTSKIAQTSRRLLVCDASKGQQNASQLNFALQQPISKSIVQRILSPELNLGFKEVKKAPPLLEYHKKMRSN